MGHMGNGHIVDVFSEFSEYIQYVNIYLWDARDGFIVYIFA